jgi:hypothetical protein
VLASPHPNEDAVVDVAVEFADRHPHLADPDLSRDRCIEAAEAFVAACQSAGVTAQVVTGARFGETEHFPGVRLLLNAHSAALICGTDMVYDWTARQFDPTADWPLVQPLPHWREQWSHPDQW